jgi:hypothetical protein
MCTLVRSKSLFPYWYRSNPISKKVLGMRISLTQFVIASCRLKKGWIPNSSVNGSVCGNQLSSLRAERKLSEYVGRGVSWSSDTAPHLCTVQQSVSGNGKSWRCAMLCRCEMKKKNESASSSGVYLFGSHAHCR